MSKPSASELAREEEREDRRARDSALNQATMVVGSTHDPVLVLEAASSFYAFLKGE